MPELGPRTSAEAGPAVGGGDGAQARRGVGDRGDGGGVRQVALQAPLLQVQLLQPPQQLVAPLLRNMTQQASMRQVIGRAFVKSNTEPFDQHKLKLEDFLDIVRCSFKIQSLATKTSSEVAAGMQLSLMTSLANSPGTQTCRAAVQMIAAVMCPPHKEDCKSATACTQQEESTCLPTAARASWVPGEVVPPDSQPAITQMTSHLALGVTP